jgi:hypothetical protein
VHVLHLIIAVLARGPRRHGATRLSGRV